MKRLMMTTCLLFTLAGILQAQPVTQVGPAAVSPAQPLDSILGIRPGASLEEVHAKLAPLGAMGGHATRDGGRKEGWTLRETDFQSIAYRTNQAGAVVWISGFLRPGKQVSFASLGNLKEALGSDDKRAVWNTVSPGRLTRLVARGDAGMASSLSLFDLSDKFKPSP